MAEIKRSNSWDRGTRQCIDKENNKKHLWNIQRTVRYIITGCHCLQYYLEQDVELVR